MRFDLM